MVEESTALIDEVVQLTVRVSRLGEADLRNWWGSRAFGPAGRVVLKQRLPRTWRMAAVELDLASAANRHNDVFDRPNAVHLFSDRWPVPRWTAAWVAEQKTVAEPDSIFEQLEQVSLDQVEAELRSETTYRAEPVADALRLGSIDRSRLVEPDAVLDAVRALATTYVGNEKFVVPYFEVVG